MIAVVEEEQATGLVAEAYERYRKHFGRQSVPGLLKCFATHPPLLEQMITLASTMLFVDGHLSRKVKEMIATQVSALNSCPYCLDSHASFLQSNGGSNDLLLSLSAGSWTILPSPPGNALCLNSSRKSHLNLTRFHRQTSMS